MGFGAVYEHFLPSGFICSQSLSTLSHTQVKQPLDVMAFLALLFILGFAPVLRWFVVRNCRETMSFSSAPLPPECITGLQYVDDMEMVYMLVFAAMWIVALVMFWQVKQAHRK